MERARFAALTYASARGLKLGAGAAAPRQPKKAVHRVRPGMKAMTRFTANPP